MGLSGVSGEQGAQAVGEGVVFEVRDTEEAFGGAFDVAGHEAQAGIMVEDAGAEVDDGEQQWHEVLQALVVEHVLELVAGLDVADGFFDAPTFDVRAYKPPQVLETVAKRPGRQQPERLSAKASNDQ